MKLLFAFAALLFAACSNPEGAAPFSTLDSNTVNMGDSIPAILHPDDARQDTSFPVAMDSLGPAVDAADTLQ